MDTPESRVALVAKFMDRFAVNEQSGCWEWTGSKYPKGYGQFWSGTRGRSGSHRFAYTVFNGPIPDGLHVCHKCDNPSCVNPDHLFVGTHGENMADMTAKKRHQFGSRSRNAKFTEDDVKEIRRAYQAGTTQPELAAKFGVSDVTISKIVLAATWRHVDTTPLKCKPGYKGERNNRAKLREVDVVSIRQRFANGEDLSSLRREYSMSMDSMWEIVTGETWQHAGGPTVSRMGHPKGESAPWSKLTDEEVRSIHGRASAGENQKTLAREFGVSQATVSRIKNRVCWAHLSKP